VSEKIVTLRHTGKVVGVAEISFVLLGLVRALQTSYHDHARCTFNLDTSNRCVGDKRDIGEGEMLYSINGIVYSVRLIFYLDLAHSLYPSE
jgi:hypothetical protein